MKHVALIIFAAAVLAACTFGPIEPVECADGHKPVKHMGLTACAKQI